MRQKPGPLRPSPTSETSGTSTSRTVPHERPVEPDFHLHGRVRPDGTNESPGFHADDPHSSTARVEPSITITQMPETQIARRGAATSPLQPYLQRVDASLGHDADGLKVHKGRKFADIANEDGSAADMTVMVAFHDLIKAYRARLPSERVPSGPPLYRVADSNLWSLKKPIEYYSPERYTLNERLTYYSRYVPDAQGYYAVHETALVPHQGRVISSRNVGFAFEDTDGRLVKVEPSEARGDASVPLKLAHWTDGEIWNAYNIHGAEVLAFRDEAQALGRAPEWARRVDNANQDKSLLNSMKWCYPQKSRIERAELLRSYNLSIAQQKRLIPDMDKGFPEWAEQHKQLTLSNDEQRFSQIAEELEPYILRLRNEGEHPSNALPDVELRYQNDFLEGYLMHSGYKRNVHGMLYRTDIPGMFRADLRTPFELARDKRLFRLKGNYYDSTTELPFSTTFSLDDALGYMNFDYYSDPLRYNSQANRYPGHVSSDSGSSYGGRFGSTDDSDNSFELDYSHDYPLRRRKQALGFLYIIDTRGVEVVPQAENIYLNNMDFQGDKLEGQISMPKRGISAERIWLVHSDRSRAARVEDVFREAGDNVESIEQATWDGTLRTHTFFRPTPYDDLIAKIASSGGVILDLPKGAETFSNDIIWPVPEHYRT
ncbi:Type III effector protein [Pseudomonas sp. IT-347P]|uniref:hypothetical protein n=1 Tax=Pseudomonas sp. IT-347P TaxID=3026458 RepID=UPI0039DFE4FA